MTFKSKDAAPEPNAIDSWLDRPLTFAQCVIGLCACVVLVVAAIVLRSID